MFPSVFIYFWCLSHGFLEIPGSYPLLILSPSSFLPRNSVFRAIRPTINALAGFISFVVAWPDLGRILAHQKSWKNHGKSSKSWKIKIIQWIGLRENWNRFKPHDRENNSGFRFRFSRENQSIKISWKKNSPFFGAPLCHPALSSSQGASRIPSSIGVVLFSMAVLLVVVPFTFVPQRSEKTLLGDRGPKRGTSEDLSGVHMYSVYIYTYITLHYITLHYITLHYIHIYIYTHTYTYIYMCAYCIYCIYCIYVRYIKTTIEDMWLQKQDICSDHFRPVARAVMGLHKSNHL